MKILRTAIFAFAVMGLAAACGGKDKGAAEPTPEPATTEPAPTDPAAPAEGETPAPAEGEAPAPQQ